MIRVNLIKASSHALAEGSMGQAGAGGSGEGLHPFLKVFFILLFPGLLYGYESFTLSEKKARLRVLANENQRIEAEVSQFGSVRSVVEDLEKEKKQLSDQLIVIQKISKKRASKLSIIHHLQKTLPYEIWLTEMNMNQNLFSFEGYSRSPSSIQKIVESLNEHTFVKLASNKYLKREKLGKERGQSFFY